jgi:replicative superfamily II helicase
VIYGRFIGVDRFSDLSIPDLSGCARDAAALYAIFQDGLPEINSELIQNDEATIERVRRVIDDTLSLATEQDAVFLTLATHGTHDHRIVAHDSSLADLDGTTYRLDDLVDQFRATRAGFVFIVLDCCFAGAAPARVVADTPFSRAIPDLPSIQGTGKLILTASRMDEEAYEHPVRRHGLLTAALADALTQPQTGVMSMIESVVARVRTEAATMGVTQNPVATTYIDGGFKLPTMRRGDTYVRYFPEYGGAQTADVNGITAFGIPVEIVNVWSERFDNHLHQLQVDAINEYRVLSGGSIFVVAPTSSGKTFIGELAAVSAILQTRKAVFLLPYKALVSEKYDDFIETYTKGLGLRVIRCNSDYRDQITEFIAGKYDIALLTYEMFLGLAVSNRAALNLIGLIVLDEAQFIASEDRGITVELILTLLRMSRSRGINPQLILLSAVLGNVTQFGDWLNVQTLVSETRPVPLEFGVLDRQGTYQFLDANGVAQINQLMPPGSIRQRRDRPSSQDVIVPLVRQVLANQNERIIVFRNKRGETEGSSQYLAHELGLPAAQDALNALPADDLSTSSPLLHDALRGGVAFHDANLNAQERSVVERFFRDRNGQIRVLTATSGVAAGINTPASTIIIVETVQPRPGNPPMFIGDVRNMAGRAGRYGYQETGRAIVLATTSFEREGLFQRYVAAQPEPIRSSFDRRDIPTWLIRLLRQVGCVKRADVPALIVNTFGGYLATLQNPNLGAQLHTEITTLLERMLRDTLLDESADGVSLTLLGNACGTSSLTFESCLRLIEAVRRLGNTPLAPETLLALLQALPEGEDIYVPMQRRGTAEGRWQVAFFNRFDRRLANEMSRNVADQYALWARYKRALIALAWTDGAAIERIEQQFSVNPYNGVHAGDVRSIAEASRFRLRSVYEIVAAATPATAPAAEEMDAFLAQLEFGIPVQLLPLLQIHVELTRANLMALLAAGVTTPEVLKAMTKEQLGLILPEQLVDRIIAH